MVSIEKVFKYSKIDLVELFRSKISFKFTLSKALFAAVLDYRGLQAQIMELNELYFKENMNQRVYNVCKTHHLLNAKALIEYYRLHGSFLKLPNCGAKTNIELIAICNKYIRLREEGSVSEVANNLFSTAIEELHRLRQHNRIAFSRRTLIVCKINKLNTLRDIMDHFDRFKTYTNLNKTGKITTAELISIFNEYQQQYQEYSKMQ